jgi:hypothetical protein
VAARARVERRRYGGGFEDADLLGCDCAGRTERHGDGVFEAEDPRGLTAWDQLMRTRYMSVGNPKRKV